jgi:hypothetical protein
MSASRNTLERIYSDLLKGHVEMALLGSSSETELRLDSPDNLKRYADMLRPNIAVTLKKDRTEERLIYVLLIALFATAITLTVLACIQGSVWKASATIPGLGVTAAWPINKLLRLRSENLKLRLMPELLPLLKREDAERIAARFLEVH